MKTYSPEENDRWYGEQANKRSVEKKYDQLTDNGRLLVKALSETHTPLSLADLEKRVGLKREDLRQALVDAQFFLHNKSERYEIVSLYRPHLKRIAT